MHEGRKQTNTWSAYAGSRLELSDALGRRRPKRHPSSRTGENPPYGMIGGIEETSASFEARSAPRSYPTPGSAGAAVEVRHLRWSSTAETLVSCRQAHERNPQWTTTLRRGSNLNHALEAPITCARGLCSIGTDRARRRSAISATATRVERTRERLENA